jgi:thioredoxin reductase
MLYDVVIAGAGPAGLSAALMLGRARKRVLVCDAGPPRNAAATHVHGFLTRDGTPPAEMRRIGREQLAPYGVEVRDDQAVSIEGERDCFRVALASGGVEARRVLLCVGMIDDLPALPGYRELWGKSIFVCPYCHGWEVRERPFGCLLPSAAWVDYALFLRGWTSDVLVFTDGRFEVPPEMRERLARAGLGLDERRIRRLVGSEHLEAVEMEDGARVARDALFARPPQRQTALVQESGVALDEQGFVKVNEQKQTSRAGVYAAGDLTTMQQGALFSAAAGAQAAAMINHELTLAEAGGHG